MGPVIGTTWKILVKTWTLKVKISLTATWMLTHAWMLAQLTLVMSAGTVTQPHLEWVVTTITVTTIRVKVEKVEKVEKVTTMTSRKLLLNPTSKNENDGIFLCSFMKK